MCQLKLTYKKYQGKSQISTTIQNNYLIIAKTSTSEARIVQIFPESENILDSVDDVTQQYWNKVYELQMDTVRNEIVMAPKFRYVDVYSD